MQSTSSLTSTSSVSIANNTNNVAQTAVATTQQIEFDPWLQYCKFNDLITGTRTLATDASSHTPMSQDLKLNEASEIDHPLNIESKENDDIDSPHYLSTSKVATSTSQKRHGQCLALSDHDRIKTFITEYLQRGLVPYAERTIKILNEQIQSKKSILKSFSIPRRIFGSSSSTSSVSMSSSKSSSQQSPVVAVSTSGLSSSNANSTGMNSNGLISITSNSFVNTNDEFQLRRLADLAFMFRLYDLAYTSYHSCKKEFSSYVTNQSNSEQLLNMNYYLSGSLEMASIANFMQQFANDLNSSSTMPSSPSTSSLSSISGSAKTYNSQYIEDSIHLLINTCKNSYFSTRATLMSTEALKANNSFLKAAYQFINFPSDDNDIRSGLFLEQAAQCYLAQPQPLIRKYAFFMSLAGHRFNQVGQKKHALRVYKHALDIYDNRHWYRAQDHIHFVMSRLNVSLKNLSQALHHILEILIKKKHKKKQEFYEFSNETNVLKDFILYSNTLNVDANNKLSSMPLPLIEYSNVKINLAPVNSALKYGKILVKNDYYQDYIQENYDTIISKLTG